MTESVYKQWVFAGKVYGFAVVDDRKWYKRQDRNAVKFLLCKSFKNVNAHYDRVVVRLSWSIVQNVALKTRITQKNVRNVERLCTV